MGGGKVLELFTERVEREVKEKAEREVKIEVKAEALLDVLSDLGGLLVELADKIHVTQDTEQGQLD